MISKLFDDIFVDDEDMGFHDSEVILSEIKNRI